MPTIIFKVLAALIVQALVVLAALHALDMFDKRTSKTPRMRKHTKLVVWLGVLAFVINVCIYLFEYGEKQEAKQEARTNAEKNEQLKKSNDEILLQASTNPAVVLAAIREKKADAEIKQQRFEEINTDKYDPKAFHEELDNSLTLARLNRAQEAIDAQARREREAQSQQMQQKQDLELKKAKVEQYYPYFDHAVTRLRDWLRDRAGKPLTSNFPKDTREMIASGEHYEISEGEKSAWTYDVVVQWAPYPNVSQTMAITCRALTYTNTATVTVHMPTVKSRWIVTQVNLSSKSTGDVGLPQNKEPLTNYKKTIDSTLRALISAQDKQMSEGITLPPPAAAP